DGEEIFVDGIRSETLFGRLAGFAEMMAREQKVSTSLQDSRIALKNGVGFVERLPAAVIIRAIAGDDSTSNVSACEHAPGVGVIGARGGARFVEGDDLIFAELRGWRRFLYVGSAGGNT